jgi:flagellum-specific peptidoglycan hydrolase FlgJ
MLLSTASPYQAAMTLVLDPDRFADALTGVYATDPQYGATLKWVIESYNLKQYDLGSVGGR